MTIEEKIAAANAKLAKETAFVEERVAEAIEAGRCPQLAAENAMREFSGPAIQTPSTVMSEQAGAGGP